MLPHVSLGVEMKVIEPKKWKVNGEVRWVFDGKINGKRKREQFDTKKACELFIKAQTKEPLSPHGGQN